MASVPAGYPPAVPLETPRRLRTAELLSVGSELTAGETRDTNAGDLARDLTRAGVRVGRISAVPDRLEIVRDAFADALRRADLVVSTGGLGPTPDDLTREAIAAVMGETTAVDPDSEAWLRELWRRRGMDMPDMNLKQAWLIPSGRAVANPNGTAPGWWVDTPDGRVVVALPGPPREMRPMWRDDVVPRLRERGLGEEQEIRTYRLTGIGESAVADLLGEDVLRRENPEVATYARAEAVDVRISAFAAGGRSAVDLVEEAERTVLEHLAKHVWARDDTTWADAIGRRLEAREWTLATVEVGTGGTLVGLLGYRAYLMRATIAPADEHGDLDVMAGDARAAAGADVGLAVRIEAEGSDTAVLVAIDTEAGTRTERRLAFLGGEQGRIRAALIAAAVLWEALGSEV
jgi:nicotinamide-nucleotide amidase